MDYTNTCKIVHASQAAHHEDVSLDEPNPICDICGSVIDSIDDYYTCLGNKDICPDVVTRLHKACGVVHLLGGI